MKKILISLTPLLAAFALTAPPNQMLAQEWTGLGASLNWSDTSNWSSGTAPSTSSYLYFSDLNYSTAYTNAVGLVNNVVEANYTIGGMNYNAQSGTANGNRHFTTLIPGGVTLTLNNATPGGGGEPMLLVGGFTTISGSTSNYTTIKGDGSLLLNNSTANMSVRQAARATLDLSGLSSLTAVVANLWVGASAPPDGSSKQGVLFLAKSNVVTTAPNLNAPGILVAKGSGNSFGNISMGQSSIFNTDGLVVGGARASSGSLFGISSYPTSLNFLPGQVDPTFKLRGSAGGSTRVSTFSIGDISATEIDYAGGPGGSAQATADFSGGIVDIRADSIFVGRSAADTGTGGSFTYGFGNLIVERGTIDVNNLYIAYKQGTNASSSLNGGSGLLPCVVTLKSNAVVTVNQGVTMAFRNNGTNGSQPPVGALLVNDNAVINIAGNITTPTNGLSTLQFGGGNVNMTGNGNVTVTALAGSGSLSGANTITVVSNLTLGTLATPGTLNLGGSLVTRTAFPITFDLGPTNTPGAGVSDYLNITGDVNFSNNPVNLAFNGNLLSGSNYTLVSFSGARNGLLTFTNSTRSEIGLDQATPGQVNLVVTNWSPATLVWQGTAAPATNLWNTSNTFWTNIVTSAVEKFYQGDAVVFDDTAINGGVYPNGLLFPASITVNANTKNFGITNRNASVASGVIAGNCSITKNGTGILTFGTFSNSFTGPINVNNGTWRLFDPNFSSPANMPTLGSITAPMYVNDGATLDFFGCGATATGKPLVIRGNGFSGQGAITNSSTSGSIQGFAVTLAGDTRIAADSGAIGLKSLLASAPLFSGSLDLNGYTLTKLGVSRFSIQEVVATTSGNINIGAGFFAIANSILDGPGSLNLSNNTYLIFGVSGTSSTTGYVAKAMNVYNAGIVAPASGNVAQPAVINSAVNLLGSLSITNTQPIVMNGVISGSFGINKYGASNLVLNAANTYSGPTIINAGSLTLGTSGSVNTPLLQFNPGTILDVTAKPGGLTLASGQTLNLNGTAVGNLTLPAGTTLLGSGTVNGSIAANLGAEIAPATTNVTGSIVVSNALTLAGAHLTWELAPSFELSDSIVVGGNLILSGVNTFTVNSIGGFDPSGTNTLITYGGTLTGGLPNLALNTTARFQVELVDPALTPGKIQVRLVSPSPLLTWKGGYPSAPTTWDVKTTTNWDNAGLPDVFWSSDLVRFDDSASTNVVNLVGNLGPGSITMDNSAVDFYFGGSGALVSAVLTNNTGNLTISNRANNFFTGDGLVLNGGSIIFAQPTNVSLTANLIGSGTFGKAGSSNLTLIGNSSAFYGAMNVSQGTLRAGSSNVLGAGAATVAAGATLDINGQFLNNSSTIQVSGAGVDGFGAINNRGLARTNALANVALTGDTTIGALSNAWGIVNGMQGGGFTLTKTNAQDVWIMTRTETDLGAIRVLQGRLVFAESGTTLGRVDTNILVAPNATLAFAPTNGQVSSGFNLPAYDAGNKPLTLLANASLEVIGAGALARSNIFGGPITMTNNAIFRVASGSYLELNGPISGTNGQLILTNGGTMALNGTNTYTSNTLVYAGTLMLSNTFALPTNSPIVLSNRVNVGNPGLQLASEGIFPTNNTLIISTASSAASLGGDGTWLGPIFWSGANSLGISGGAAGFNLLGTLTTTNATGAVSIEGTATRISGNLRFTNEMSIGVSSGLGAGFDERFTTVRFDGDNFWSSTRFGRGRITLGRNNALPPNAPMTLGVLSAGVGDRRLFLDLNGYNQTVTTLTETAVGDSTIRFGNSSTNSNSMLTVAPAAGVTNTWAIVLKDDLDNQLDHTNTLGLTLNSGSLILVNSNTYTGPTFINGGTLLLNIGTGLNAGRSGAIGNSVVTVSGTGTLGGNGNVDGPVTVAANGTLSPGTSIGALTINNNLTLAAGSKCAFEVNLGAGTNDLILGINQLTIGGTLVITNVGAQPFVNGSQFKLFEFVSATAGSINILPPTPGSGLAWDSSTLAIDGILRVTTPPPAPTISGVAKLPDNNFSISFTGVDGRLYSLRASTDVATPVANWPVLQSGTQLGGTTTFFDRTATNSPQKFYLISSP